ncbi:MAG TPA: hypothetical protein VH589_26885 [Trebonia sp.]
MAHGKRRTRLPGSAALLVTALVVTALAGACTSAPAASTGGAASGAGHGTRAVTTAQARHVFASYVDVADRAAVSRDTALASSVVTGVQQTTVSAQLKAAQSGDWAVARYRYGSPAFYLPQPGGYPRWFVASVRRTLASQPAPAGSPGNPNGTAGVRLAATGQVLMVFEQAGKTSPWRLASASQLPAGEAVPPLAVNGAGYVATVPLSSGAQLSRPDVVGPLQAAVVDDGPASPAATAVAAGSLTTGIYAAARVSAGGLRAPPGDVYEWELEGAPYTMFALRTASGGALVFYAMYLNSAVEVPAVLNKGVVRPGPPITVPGYLTFLLKPGGHVPRVQLSTQQLLSFAAVDPPAGAGKVRVIAMGGGLVYAGAS